jgi:hypothetical protein
MVSECFGPMAVGGTMIQALCELRDRWLAPSGMVVPREVTLWIAPAESEDNDRFVRAWDSPRYGIDWSTATRFACNNLYNTSLAMQSLIAEPQSLITIDLTRDRFTGRISHELTFSATRSSVMHGFCGWFSAQLCVGVALDTGPAAPATLWRQVWFPLARATPIARGARIGLAFSTVPSEVPQHCVYFDWRTEVGGETFTQSTRLSFPHESP